MDFQLEFGSYVLIGILIAFLGRKYIFRTLSGLGDVASGKRRDVVVEDEKEPGEMLPHDEAMLAIKNMDERRRNVLKLFGLGAAAFVVGKVVGPSMSFLPSDVEGDTTLFKNFRVVERGENLGFFDNYGNEILTLEGDISKS
jgi:hypothetical protein